MKGPAYKYLSSMGITGKIVASLLVAASASALVIVFILLQFDRFEKHYLYLSEQHIPALSLVTELMHETDRLIGLAPDILQAKNRFIRASILKRLEQSVDRSDTILEVLSMTGAGPEKAGQISRQYDSIIESTKEFAGLADRHFAVKQEIERILRRLSELEEETHLLLGEDDQQLRMKSMLDHLLVHIFRQHLIDSGNKLHDAKGEFSALIAQLEDSKDNVAPEYRLLFISALSELTAYGVGEDNIYDLKAQSLELQHQIETNLLRSRFLFDAMVSNINSIVFDIKEATLAEGQRIHTEITTLSRLLLLIPLVTVFALIFIYLFVRRSILGRLFELQHVMEAHAEGRQIPVEVRGSDEITEMAKAVEYYLGEISAREQALKGALVQAEAANKAKSTFLANMSHELRTPLNAILGFSELMASSGDITREQRENLEIISDSGRGLLDLITDVLDMARIDTGQLGLNPEPVDIDDFSEQLILNFHGIAESKGLQLKLEKRFGSCRVLMVDPSKLRHVLKNIIGNAFKFTARGGVTISFETMPVENSDRARLWIEVKDTGSGIVAEDQQRIFDPFVQVGEPAEQKGVWGTGLGLSISRQFIEMMGGTIEVESTPGEGALFRVTLELESEQETIQDTDVEYMGAAREAGEFAGCRILIAEDQYASRLLLRKIVERMDCEVREAKDGYEAIQVFKEWKPDLILLDMRMPVLDGMETTRKLRSMAGDDVVKIVAVTAASMPEQRDEMLAVGMQDVISKPYRSAQIYHCINTQLGLNFDYSSQVEEVVETQITPEAIAALPGQLREEIRNAAIELDMERLTSLVGEVEKLDASLAVAMSQLIDNYNVTPLLKLLEQAG